VVGDALVGHPDVRRVAFTGSTDVGRHVVAVAGPQLKRISLELGGSDPVIVCEDGDLDAAVKAVIIGRYWNAGQACLGCKRVFVHDSMYDDFVTQLVDRVKRYEPGADSRLVTEEVFGPVLPVFRYSDFDDVIRRANATPYGLGSSIWTHDVRKIHRAAQEIESGMTWVNQIHYGYDELPFGGVKASGFGKEHGLEALDSYVELKSVVIGGLS
jgi:acyl-CoA reductase-like NAD-dependent aldehyde dehydrogenase